MKYHVSSAYVSSFHGRMEVVSLSLSDSLSITHSQQASVVRVSFEGQLEQIEEGNCELVRALIKLGPH